jgi:hypothetical protein
LEVPYARTGIEPSALPITTDVSITESERILSGRAVKISNL